MFNKHLFFNTLRLSTSIHYNCFRLTVTPRMLAGIGNQVAFWWMRCQFYINPNYSAFFSCIHFPSANLGALQVQSVMQKVWILLSKQPPIPQKRMGDYYHKHHAGHPCLRGALYEAPRKKHTTLFPLNTHMFALLSSHNCCSTNPVVSWGGEGAAWDL